MKLLHGADDVGDVLDDMDGAEGVEGVVAEGIREMVEVAQHVGAAARIAVDADSAGIFVDTAADVERRLGADLLDQLQAFLQCIDSEIGLIARDDERRTEPNSVASGAEHQQAALEGHRYEPVAQFGRAVFEIADRARSRCRSSGPSRGRRPRGESGRASLRCGP